MITLERSMRHLAWSDAWLFAALSEYPDEAFAARYAAGSWTVGEIAKHIVDGAEWYRYCLMAEPWTDIAPLTSGADAAGLAAHLRAVDDMLVAQCQLPDAIVSFDDENGPVSVHRSTLLSQACLHAVEHRAQIACALEAGGFAPLALDDVDFWSFERYEAAASGD